MRRTAFYAASAAVLLLLGACSLGTDGSQVAVGPGGAVATSAPLAVPPVLPGADPATSAQADAPRATTAPVAAPAESVVAQAVLPTGEPVPILVEDLSIQPLPTQPVPTQPVPTQPAVSFDEPLTESSAAVVDSEPAAPAQPAATTAVPSAPAPTATATGAIATQQEAPPAQPAGGPTIALGDFEVVNLITQQKQNIAELSPGGATMLWFWAPH